MYPALLHCVEYRVHAVIGNSLPVLYAIFQLLQEVKVQGIELSNVEEDLFPSVLGEDGSARQLGCLDGTVNHLR